MTGTAVRHGLSAGQRRLWFLEQLAPGRTGYLTPCSYLVEGDVDADAVEKALRHVARRHEVLRSTVEVVDGEPYAVPGAPDTVQLERVDLCTSPDPDAGAERLVRELLDEPWDLSTRPPLRAVLIGLGARRSLFHFHVHHIAFDGMSRPVFERELSAAYESFSAGLAPAPDEPVHSYAEYARSLQASLDGGESARLLGYWCEHLDDAPRVLELPAAHPRPAEFDISGDELRFDVPGEVATRLRQVADAQRTSLFSVTLAVYQALLARYCGTAQVVVGTPFAGRGDADVEDTIGFFTNTVVLYGDLRAEPSLAALTEQVRDTVLDAMDHQDVPFERLVERLDSEHRVDRAPLVQHWFDLGDGLLLDEALNLAGTRITAVEYPETTTRFDTELHLVATADEVSVRLVYARSLFDRAAMRRFGEHFLRLLDEASGNPGARLSDLAPLTGADRREVLALGAGPAAGSPAASTVVERFDAVVATTPDAVAVTSGATALTYRELDGRAETLARHLRALGAGPERVVGICLPRGVELVVATLAVVKAGAGYLPLDPELPADRLAYLLQDSRAVLVVADETAATRLPDTGARTVRLDRPLPEGSRDPVEVRPDGLFYVVYTSGSTGRPKGVAVAHRSFANLLDWHLARYPSGPGTVVAQTASSSFDAAAWEIWPALVSGARLDLCSEAMVRSPEALVRHLAETGTTTAFVPTALAEHLIRHPLGTATALRRVLTGGDLFRPRAHDDPGIPVVNHYGPTENTVVATASASLRAPWEDVSIGRPVDGVCAYVVDGSLNLVPRGAPGELCLGGDSVARGYPFRGRLTAERFVPDPFAGTVRPGKRGSRMYRTGDLVRWRADGSLDFLGRTDEQLKLSGYRIEPGEVESALLRCGGVAEAVVTVSTAGPPILVAHVVPQRGGEPPSPAALRTALRRDLPSYMVPSAFVFLPRLPLTTSGKIDRRRLPPAAAAVVEPTLPRTPLEEVVHGLWTEVLPPGEFGVESDFFAAGGTSMSASRLVTRIRERFRIEFGVRAVFDLRTVAEQCATVLELMAAEITKMSPDEITEALGEDAG